MAVVIEDKAIDFKQQRQVLGEQGKSCDACRFLCQIGHSLFVTGQPVQRFGEGLSCVLQEQMGQRYDRLTISQKIPAAAARFAPDRAPANAPFDSARK